MASTTTGSRLRTLGRVLSRIVIVLLVTVILLVFGLYCAIYVIAKGPSPTARDIFVRSVRETSAMGFVANLYFSESEIQKITGSGQEPEYIQMDASLIDLPEKDETPQNPNQGPQPDAWGMVERAIRLGCPKIQLVKGKFDQAMIDKAHQNGIICNVFWSDDPTETREYLEMGIDVILTNDYNRIAQVVSEYRKA